MNKMISGLILFLFFIPVYADESAPPAETQLLKHDQGACIQARANYCIGKCHNSAAANCNQVCYRIATRECAMAAEDD